MPFKVIGVTARDFVALRPCPSFWVPLMMRMNRRVGARATLTDRNSEVLALIGRLAPGSCEQLRRPATNHNQLAQAYPSQGRKRF